MSSPLSEIGLQLRRLRGELRQNVPLAPYTHVRIGGPAAWFVEPLTEEDAALAAHACHETGVPLFVLGGGSNLLVSDAGVEGVVLSLSRLDRIVRDRERIIAGAGVSLPSLLRKTREVGLAGLETLTGIPAVVGGAVAMNAGTKEGETFDVLESLVVIEPGGELRSRGKQEFPFHYRDGGLEGRIVLQATFALRPDDPDAILRRFEESLRRRNATQPVAQHSVGCVFQNPPGDVAGRLIEAAGLKLLRRGAVSVSSKHANYFVNDGEGTCRDFLELMEEVQRVVRERFGVELRPEVKIWGI
jgi:UDP-N-acetylmuramate dehydrogenase